MACRKEAWPSMECCNIHGLPKKFFGRAEGAQICLRVRDFTEYGFKNH
jgi:hypothetical protein